MSNITLDELRPLLTREIRSKRTLLLAVFVATALACLAVALLWQNTYRASVVLTVNDQRTINPDRAADVRARLVDTAILDQVLRDTGLLDDATPPARRKVVRETLMRNTDVTEIDNRLVEIGVSHGSAGIAFDAVSRFAALFIEQTARGRSGNEASIGPGIDASVYQAAAYPHRPDGIRFVHIAVFGLLFALVLPLLALLVYLKLDPRIRTASVITDKLELPLLASVPRLEQSGARVSLFSRTDAIVALIVAVVLLYCGVVLYKYTQVLSSQGVSLV